jgi:hypothetical protein
MNQEIKDYATDLDNEEEFSILKEQKLLGKLYECQEEIEKVLNKKNDNECAFLIKILIKLVENNLQNKNTFI